MRSCFRRKIAEDVVPEGDVESTYASDEAGLETALAPALFLAFSSLISLSPPPSSADLAVVFCCPTVPFQTSNFPRLSAEMSFALPASLSDLQVDPVVIPSIDRSHNSTRLI